MGDVSWVLPWVLLCSQVEAGDLMTPGSPILAYMDPAGYSPLATAVPIGSHAHPVPLSLPSAASRTVSGGAVGYGNGSGGGGGVVYYSGARRHEADASYPFAHAVAVPLD